MGGRTGNRNKSYVECMSSELQLTCLIHGHVHSPEHYKLLNECGKSYSDGRSTEESKH